MDVAGNVLIWGQAEKFMAELPRIPQKKNAESWEDDFQISGVATLLGTLVQIPPPENLHLSPLILQPTKDNMLKLVPET